MSKKVKVSLTIPEDILQAVKVYDPDTTLSTAVSKLLRLALNGECVASPGPILRDESMNQRVETLEHDMSEFREQMV